MLSMPQINNIRDLSRNGFGISDISRQTGTDPKTIRKYLMMDDFSKGPPIKKVTASIVAPFHDKIMDIIEEDNKHWSKQRHTAKRIFERIRDENGYTGSYDAVQKYVQRLRQTVQTKGTQELVWEPGCGQVDFGEADFNEDTDCIRRKYLTTSFPYSNDGFAQVFRGETAECVCQGLKDIFEYIGGVPTLLVFDNATGVGKRMVDEWGYVPVDRDGSQLLFRIISDSYESKSLLLTTNLEFSKWGSIFTDDQMAAAMIDRLVHHGHLIRFEGTSYRMEHALMKQTVKQPAA